MSETPAPLFISAPAIEGLFNWTEAIQAVRSVYQPVVRAEAAPPRVVAHGEQGVWFRALAAVSPTGRYMGAKLFGLSRERSVSYLMALFDQQTGRIACLMDANGLTAYRTAATSALAVDALAPEVPARIGLIGSGAEARSHLRAIATVRAIETVKVFSPTAANREKFAIDMASELKLDCRSVNSAQEAVDSATVVVAAARSRDETPTFVADWIRDGVLVVSIGSTLPSQREVETAVIDRADLIVADVPEEVARDTGDFIACTREGVAFEHKLVSLHEAVIGGRTGVFASPKRPLFKSVGSAMQDLAIAELCLSKATQLGRTVPLGVDFELKAGRARRPGA